MEQPCLWITPHVTTFARSGGAASLSVRSNLQAEAIATVGRGPTNFSFIGLNGINGNGTSTVSGSMASDGNINLGGTRVVGDARPGLPPATLTYGSNGTVTGWQANLDYLLAPTYPKWTVANYISEGGQPLPTAVKKVYSLLGSNNPALPKVYYGSFAKNSSEIKCDGYVRVYATSDVDLMGCSITNQQTPLTPAKFDLRVIGPYEVKIGGTPKVYAHISAPESDIKINGTPDYTGTMVGKSLTIVGTVLMYGDTSGNNTTPFTVKLVK